MDKKREMNLQELKALVIKMSIRYSLLMLFLGSLLILSAGTFNFWQVYLYLSVLLVMMVSFIYYFIRYDPKLLERRTSPLEKEKQQKILSAVLIPVILTGFILPGLDHRFGWSEVPVYLVIIADIIIFSGYLFIFFVFKQNSYASRVVEVSDDQKVITTGFYKVLRHPQYLGVLLMFLPTSIALVSYWGLIPMIILPVGLVLRIINEENVLTNNLPGYKEYCQKTKYHLIPFIW